MEKINTWQDWPRKTGTGLKVIKSEMKEGYKGILGVVMTTN